jgi:hypothetical protein
MSGRNAPESPPRDLTGRLIEQGFGFDAGHEEMIAVVEREIRAIEGNRWTDHPALAGQTS